MRWLPALLVVLLVGCTGGSATSPSAAPSTADQPSPASSAAQSSGAASAEPSGAPAGSAAPSAAGGLPAGCAAGFAAYLVEIEPIVSGFDPATATLGDLDTVDQAVHEKSIELLDANDSRATYDCSAIGVVGAYSAASAPWAAVGPSAAAAAPGTVAYLTALRDWKGLDEAALADYDIPHCDAAVDYIQEAVAGQTTTGVEGVEEMPLADGLRLLGVYRAYLQEVRNEVCPRDELGNDEFGFFGVMG
jgi:hypothetical protein